MPLHRDGAVSDHIDIEEHFLPREMRLDLCMALLEQAGAEKVKVVEHRGEINCCCVLPWHPDRTPSASLNFDRLTYICKSCNSSGGLYWLTQTILDGDYDAARQWLGTAGFGGATDSLPDLLAFLDALDESFAKGVVRTPLPRYSEKVLEPWERHVYPGLTTGVPDLGIVGRGIPEENLRRARVGWDMDSNRIIIPLWVDGALVGWQSRRILNDGSPKYLGTPDFPRNAILGLPDDRRRVIINESPMGYLKHLHHAPICCTYGASIDVHQISLLKWYDEITFATDNDPAGWAAIEGSMHNGDYISGAGIILSDYTKVTCWEYDWHADPGDFDEQTFEEIDEARVPIAIWTKPTGTLRCWLCKQPHTGECP